MGATTNIAGDGQSVSAHGIRVSVVIAVYRPDPVYFPTAIRSILAQTLGALELVIVEAPSSSSAAVLLADIPDPRIRLFVNEGRTSLIDQRNRCLAEARCEYIAVLDADDIAEPDRLERQVEFMDRHPLVAAVGSQLRIVDPEGRVLGFHTYPLDHAGIFRGLPRYPTLSQTAVMYRKRDVIAVGGYRPSVHQTAKDYDLWSRLALADYRMANLPLPLVHYRIHPGQTKSVRLRDTIRGVLAVKRGYWIGRMTFSERLQMWAETLLLHLPVQVVLFLVVRRRWLACDERLLAAPGDGPAARRPRVLPDSDRPHAITYESGAAT